MIGAIADGVDSHAKAHLCSFTSMLEKFLAIHVENTAIIFFAKIRLEHGGSMRAKCAIHKRLDGTNPQPIITKARSQAKLIGLVEQFYREVLEYTQLEPALRVELLQRHKRITAIKIVNAGQAHLP